MGGASSSGLPLYAMVSTDVRRDLIAPLRAVDRLRLIHFYRRAPYGDMTEADHDPTLVRYAGPLDLYARLRGARPDVVQGVEPFSVRLLPSLYAVTLATRDLRRPLVLVTLENRPLDVKQGRTAPALRALLRPVFRQARLIIYLNRGARRNVLTVGPFGDKLRSLMYGTWGIDPAEFSPRRDGRERAWGGPAILFVGRLHAEKGVLDLLDAYGHVRRSRPETRLVLAGDGSDRPRVEQIVRDRGWSNDIRVLGTVPHRDLPPLLRSASVFCAPSVTTRKWEEQVGMTNLQALACGVPVVTTRSGAIPEYVPDDIAVLVPERAPRELAAALTDLLDDEAKRRRLAAAGRAYAVVHYDAHHNVARMEDTILELVGTRPCG